MFGVQKLSENIKKYRKKSGMKQFELAEKLYVTPQAVSKWEQSVSVPDTETVCRLANILGVSVDMLLSDESVYEKLMVAIDGGGTKTEFVLFNDRGMVKRRIVLGGSNPNIVGLDKTFEVLKTGIDSLCPLDAKVGGIYCGIAGGISGNNREQIKKMLHKTYPDAVSDCSSDMLSVAASVTTEDRCIVAICGTGSSIAAISADKINRVGGWGYLFDGKGSGFDIGRDAISAALAEEDGIGPKTMLTELITKRLGGSVWDSIGKLYSGEKSYIASFAGEVFEAYKAGDSVAIDIVRNNFRTFAGKIKFASERYDCGKTVVISGGLTNQKEILLEIIKEELDPNLEIVFPQLPQIFGACRCSCKICGITADENFTKNFTQDYMQYIRGEENA